MIARIKGHMSYVYFLPQEEGINRTRKMKCTPTRTLGVSPVSLHVPHPIPKQKITLTSQRPLKEDEQILLGEINLSFR